MIEFNRVQTFRTEKRISTGLIWSSIREISSIGNTRREGFVFSFIVEISTKFEQIAIIYALCAIYDREFPLAKRCKGNVLWVALGNPCIPRLRLGDAKYYDTHQSISVAYRPGDDAIWQSVQLRSAHRDTPWRKTIGSFLFCRIRMNIINCKSVRLFVRSSMDTAIRG